MRVFLDPGHGGVDTGAAYGDLAEKDLVLEMARALGAALVEAGHTVGHSRLGDERVSLHARGELSEKFDAELVLSIHANANGSPGIKGLMAFYMPGDDRGKALAEAIAERCPEGLKRRQMTYAASADGWPRVRNVLGFYKAPAVLVEVGFLSNDSDREYLASDDGKAALMAMLAEGIGAVATEAPSSKRSKRKG